MSSEQVDNVLAGVPLQVDTTDSAALSQATTPLSEGEEILEKQLSSRRKGRLRRSLPRMDIKLGLGLLLTLGIVFFAILGPFLTQNPREYGNAPMQAPSGAHLLGTNNLGADVLAQLAEGAAGSLLVGATAGFIAVVFSLFFGIVAGYRGGFVDEALSLVTNIMLVIPGLPLVIVVAAYMETRSMWMIALVLGVTSWAGSAVVLRLQAKSLRNRDYVSASRTAGEKGYRIILVEILPNLLPLLASMFLSAVVLAVLSEAGLSYLGLGPSGAITWGTMLNQAAQQNAFHVGAWWWFVPPGLLIALLGCGLSLINFSIDETINPKLRAAPDAVRSVRKAERELRRKDAQRKTLASAGKASK
jgi:peptide/nickel transport system permease protein